MITAIKDLVDICTSELQIREYREEYAANICSHWDSLIQWMDANSTQLADASRPSRRSRSGFLANVGR